MKRLDAIIPVRRAATQRIINESLSQSPIFGIRA